MQHDGNYRDDASNVGFFNILFLDTGSHHCFVGNVTTKLYCT